MKPLIFEKPAGVRDYLPALAARKRRVERTLSETYGLWGYDEVITPTFEYEETFESSSRPTDDRVFKFFDRTGRTVVLRTDMTAPIARVVASLLRDCPLPVRLSYSASIFRQQELVAGRDSEFTQAGIELIGDGSPAADAEVMALAAQALCAAGLRGFQLAIGQIQFLKGVLEEFTTDADVRAKLTQSLADKDYVGYERHLLQAEEVGGLAAGGYEALTAVIGLRGSIDVVRRARQLTHRADTVAALDNLEAIWDVLSLYGVIDHMQIDLGLLLGQNYYTGAVFEGYAPGVGFPVCGGGRYDHLMGNFGRPAPATGFMIGIERVLEGLGSSGDFTRPVSVFLAYVENDRRDALRLATVLREQGVCVVTQGMGQESAAPLISANRDNVYAIVRDGKLEVQESDQGDDADSRSFEASSTPVVTRGQVVSAIRTAWNGMRASERAVPSRSTNIDKLQAHAFDASQGRKEV